MWLPESKNGSIPIYIMILYIIYALVNYLIIIYVLHTYDTKLYMYIYILYLYIYIYMYDTLDHLYHEIPNRNFPKSSAITAASPRLISSWARKRIHVRNRWTSCDLGPHGDLED